MSLGIQGFNSSRPNLFTYARGQSRSHREGESSRPQKASAQDEVQLSGRARYADLVDKLQGVSRGTADVLAPYFERLAAAREADSSGRYAELLDKAERELKDVQHDVDREVGKASKEVAKEAERRPDADDAYLDRLTKRAFSRVDKELKDEQRDVERVDNWLTKIERKLGLDKPQRSDAPAPASSDASSARLSEINIRVGGHHFEGAPIAEVTVDGKQVGRYTIKADARKGEFQTITIRGDFGESGPSRVGVRFVNDAWDPKRGDRNLVIDSVQVNGTTYDGRQADYHGAKLGKWNEVMPRAGEARFDVRDNGGPKRPAQDASPKKEPGAPVHGRPVQKTDRRVGDLEQRVLDSVADLRKEVKAAVGGNAHRLDEVEGRVEALDRGQKKGFDRLEGRIDELDRRETVRHSQTLDRLDDLEGKLDDVGAKTDGLEQKLEEGLNELKQQIEEAEPQPSAFDEALKKEIASLQETFDSRVSELAAKHEEETSALLEKLDEVTTQLKEISEQSAETIRLLEDRLGNLGGKFDTLLAKFDVMGRATMSLRSVNLFMDIAKTGDGALDKLIGVLGADTNKMLTNLQFRLNRTASRFGGVPGGLNLFA